MDQWLRLIQGAGAGYLVQCVKVFGFQCQLDSVVNPGIKIYTLRNYFQLGHKLYLSVYIHTQQGYKLSLSYLLDSEAHYNSLAFFIVFLSGKRIRTYVVLVFGYDPSCTDGCSD